MTMQRVLSSSEIRQLNWKHLNCQVDPDLPRFETINCPLRLPFFKSLLHRLRTPTLPRKNLEEMDVFSVENRSHVFPCRDTEAQRVYARQKRKALDAAGDLVDTGFQCVYRQ